MGALYDASTSGHPGFRSVGRGAGVAGLARLG
ncbi:hypothetical protein VAB18032_24260 [Micromonospora maris AB-18-032]|nr:hypothetical protein VAB18032_24260 [Micromonospora maris AB-18-032]